ncbi:hypothetical protein DPV78_008824 [Talaromyces pinophilus]|nr:hypothetical protein DPV78_008824 [Talaromyces pinophilus]
MSPLWTVEPAPGSMNSTSAKTATGTVMNASSEVALANFILSPGSWCISNLVVVFRLNNQPHERAQNDNKVESILE